MAPAIKKVAKLRSYVQVRRAGAKGKGSSVNLTVENATPAEVVSIIKDGLNRQPAASTN